MTSRNRNAFCSFCRKSYQNVGPLVEGPADVYICGECVQLCQSIIDQEKRRRFGASPNQPPSPSARENFDHLIRGYEDAKSILLDAARANGSEKRRVLLVGPSRSSALLLAKAVAFASQVPFASGEVSDLEKSGRENPFFALLDAADFDLELAQRGVLFVSGVDLVAAQDTLLRLWRDGVYDGVYEPAAGLRLDGILFICAGAFVAVDSTSLDALKSSGARSEWVECLSGVACVPPFDDENWMRVVERVDFRRPRGGL
jgi:ATP-dependent Clp protease ATP-binding subunit ClpX